jgi:DNA-binding beta-propeller fold protein YncE
VLLSFKQGACAKNMNVFRLRKKKINKVSFVSKLFVVSIILAFLGGCATGPKESESGFIFYPPSPNPPFIQYLHTFSNENDVGDGVGQLGKFLLGSEEDLSPITKPYGTAIHDGKIYVVDARGAGYAVFDLKKEEFRFVIGSGGGFLKKPINMFIDKDGYKYVTDTGRDQIIVFGINDEYVRAYGEEGQFKPSDVVVVGGRLYITDLLNHSIQVLDKRTGMTIDTFGSAGSGDDQLFHPTNLAVMGDYLFVADTSNGRIQKFTLTGEHVASIGKLGINLGDFARPKGVALDREQRLYVVDAAFENVQIFDEEGKLLLYFGSPGKDRDSINLPTAVTIDYENTQYFEKYASPNFKLEYLILVASQFGLNKVNVYEFGRMEGMDYSSAMTN